MSRSIAHTVAAGDARGHALVTLDGRYHVLERIAAGGMGEVFRAHDAVLAREVAIKVLHRSLAGDQGFVDRFRDTLSIIGASTALYISDIPFERPIGAVRVGFSANEVEAEIRRAMAPVILGILAILAGGLVCSTYLVWQINRPIVKLVRIASHISRGELDVPLSGTRDSGEFGELSRALERMRSSVKAAMARLN